LWSPVSSQGDDERGRTQNGEARRGMTTANPRFHLLDSLRAIAALMVFALHLPWVARLGLDNPGLLAQLDSGVALFFLISGFLLYRPFARSRYAGEKTPGLLPYAVRRGLRIFPAYWVALVGVVLLVGASGEALTATPVFSARGALAYFPLLQVYDSHTLLGGISAAWTLAVELSFYALLPLWAMVLRRVPCKSSGGFLRTELLALCALFVVGVTWTSIAAAQGPAPAAAFVDVTLIKPWLYVLPAYLDQFALGMALAVLSVVVADRARTPAAVRVVDQAPWLPWLVAGLVLLVMGSVPDWLSGHTTEIIAIHELQGIFALGVLLPAVFGDPDRGLVRKLLANRILLWIGLISYGVYLWHVAIMSKLVDLGALDTLGRFGFTATALGVTLVAAAASFYGLERHALRLGRRLSHRRRAQDADARMRDLREHEHERPEPRPAEGA
jgi:peptidoglycan/LPS O-acetylase OafA/YrhL